MIRIPAQIVILRTAVEQEKTMKYNDLLIPCIELCLYDIHKIIMQLLKCRSIS